jgi:hypothetical protein
VLFDRSRRSRVVLLTTSTLRLGTFLFCDTYHQDSGMIPGQADCTISRSRGHQHLSNRNVLHGAEQAVLGCAHSRTGKARGWTFLHRPCELTDCATLRAFIKDNVDESPIPHRSFEWCLRVVSRPFDGVEASPTSHQVPPSATRCQRWPDPTYQRRDTDACFKRPATMMSIIAASGLMSLCQNPTTEAPFILVIPELNLVSQH